MEFKIQKELIYQVLFVICIAVPYLNNYELTFAIWSIVALFTLQTKYYLPFLKLLGLFILILVLAFISSLFREPSTYSFVRDIAYMLKPFLGLLVGYQLCKKHIKKPLNLAIYAGFFLAVSHILLMTYNITFLSIRNMHVLRMYSGYFSDYEVYALLLLVFYKEFEIDISINKRRWFMVILSVSIFFYLARTNFIQFVVIFLALKGYFSITKRSILVLGSLFLFSIITYSAILAYNPSRGAKGVEAFLYKIKIAPIEPFKTKIDVDNWKDFNDNYRSYENILTIRQVTKGGFSSIVFGEGLGSSIDLKKEVWLQSSYMRYIPFLHNGFMTVFLKAGLLGVFILILTITMFFTMSKSDIPLVQNINLMFFGTGVFLILSYWVFMGFYFVPESKAIFIGLLYCYKERIIKKEIIKNA